MDCFRVAAISLGASLMVTAVGSAGEPAKAASEGAAYFVAEFTLRDRAAMRPYAEGVERTFQPFGGEFLVRGGEAKSVEGAPVEGGVVIIRFGSMADAKAWYDSPAYAPLKAIRQRAATTRAYIVPGLRAISAP